jgi:biopolymer transport protein ExbD
MSFRFADARPRRRPSLTPMIDVVFLLLVFFMLAARFGQEGGLDLRIAGADGAAWEGPPRLVQVADGDLRLNGQAVDEAGLVQALTRLMETDGDLVLIQPAEGVALQRLLDVMAVLEAGGLTALALVDP